MVALIVLVPKIYHIGRLKIRCIAVFCQLVIIIRLNYMRNIFDVLVRHFAFITIYRRYSLNIAYLPNSRRTFYWYRKHQHAHIANILLNFKYIIPKLLFIIEAVSIFSNW